MKGSKQPEAVASKAAARGQSDISSRTGARGKVSFEHLGKLKRVDSASEGCIREQPTGSGPPVGSALALSATWIISEAEPSDS